MRSSTAKSFELRVFMYTVHSIWVTSLIGFCKLAVKLSHLIPECYSTSGHESESKFQWRHCLEIQKPPTRGKDAAKAISNATKATLGRVTSAGRTAVKNAASASKWIWDGKSSASWKSTKVASTIHSLGCRSLSCQTGSTATNVTSGSNSKTSTGNQENAKIVRACCILKSELSARSASMSTHGFTSPLRDPSWPLFAKIMPWMDAMLSLHFL